MIPFATKSSLAEAKYTKLFKDVMYDSEGEETSAYNELLSTFTDLGTGLDEENRAESLLEELISNFKYYEINDEDEDVFIDCIKDTYHEWYHYYIQLFKGYDKEYDYALNNKRVVTREDSSTHDATKTRTPNLTHKRSKYDLPNRTVSDTENAGIMTGKDVDTDTGTDTDRDIGGSSYDSTITHEFNNKFIELKNEYLRHVRDLYHEFADKFKECFIMIYN